jgi:hypothetical protein
MTVKELIEELKKVENKNLHIRIHGTGPDGWVYYNDLEYCDKEVVFEEFDFEGKLVNQYRTRFVISGGMF